MFQRRRDRLRLCASWKTFTKADSAPGSSPRSSEPPDWARRNWTPRRRTIGGGMMPIMALVSLLLVSQRHLGFSDHYCKRLGINERPSPAIWFLKGQTPSESVGVLRSSGQTWIFDHVYIYRNSKAVESQLKRWKAGLRGHPEWQQSSSKVTSTFHRDVAVKGQTLFQDIEFTAERVKFDTAKCRLVRNRQPRGCSMIVSQRMRFRMASGG